MTPWLDDGDVRLYHGDALDVLCSLPGESVQCIVTSPPFWGLRDYGTGSWSGGDESCDHLGPPKASTKSGLKNDGRPADRVGQNEYERGATVPYRDECGKCGAVRVDSQIGLEATPELWCAKLVEVMREARRVLRSDGVCWLEVGDTYAGGGGYSPGSPSNVARQEARANGVGFDGPFAVRDESHYQARKSNRSLGGVKPKDLVGAPWLLAFALRADGWYLRSDTIWSRPNPMPESVTDRPTKAHSYVFLLTKSARYYFDADSIREPSSPGTIERFGKGGAPRRASLKDDPNELGNQADLRSRVTDEPLAGRNARSVWSVATESTPFAHFATFPQALVERCIKAGTSEFGACPECGAPWRRVVKRTAMVVTPTAKRAAWQATDDHARTQVGGTMTKPPTSVTTGWEASCGCAECFLCNGRGFVELTMQRLKCGHCNGTGSDAPPVVPCVVLDPFMGSGTTALVARRLGRHAVGIELNESYLAIAAERLQQLSLLGGSA